MPDDDSMQPVEVPATNAAEALPGRFPAVYLGHGAYGFTLDRDANARVCVTRVVLDVADNVDCTASKLTNPNRLIVELRAGTGPPIPTEPMLPAVKPPPVISAEISKPNPSLTVGAQIGAATVRERSGPGTPVPAGGSRSENDGRSFRRRKRGR